MMANRMEKLDGVLEAVEPPPVRAPIDESAGRSLAETLRAVPPSPERTCDLGSGEEVEAWLAAAA